MAAGASSRTRVRADGLLIRLRAIAASHPSSSSLSTLVPPPFLSLLCGVRRSSHGTIWTGAQWFVLLPSHVHGRCRPLRRHARRPGRGRRPPPRPQPRRVAAPRHGRRQGGLAPAGAAGAAAAAKLPRRQSLRRAGGRRRAAEARLLRRRRWCCSAAAMADWLRRPSGWRRLRRRPPVAAALRGPLLRLRGGLLRRGHLPAALLRRPLRAAPDALPHGGVQGADLLAAGRLWSRGRAAARADPALLAGRGRARGGDAGVLQRAPLLPRPDMYLDLRRYHPGKYDQRRNRFEANLTTTDGTVRLGGACQVNRTGLYSDPKHRGALQSWFHELKNFNGDDPDSVKARAGPCDVVVEGATIFMKLDAGTHGRVAGHRSRPPPADDASASQGSTCTTTSATLSTSTRRSTSQASSTTRRSLLYRSGDLGRAFAAGARLARVHPRHVAPDGRFVGSLRRLLQRRVRHVLHAARRPPARVGWESASATPASLLPGTILGLACPLARAAAELAHAGFSARGIACWATHGRYYNIVEDLRAELADYLRRDAAVAAADPRGGSAGGSRHRLTFCRRAGRAACW